jgi:hypothetical protein
VLRAVLHRAGLRLIVDFVPNVRVVCGESPLRECAALWLLHVLRLPLSASTARRVGSPVAGDAHGLSHARVRVTARRTAGCLLPTVRAVSAVPTRRSRSGAVPGDSRTRTRPLFSRMVRVFFKILREGYVACMSQPLSWSHCPGGCVPQD